MKETLGNLSKTTYRPQFRNQFKELDEEAKAAIAEAIEELATDYLTEPWNHPKVKYIESQGDVWRLKVRNQRKGKIDHRIFFNVNNDGLIFLTVEHRDTAYQP